MPTPIVDTTPRQNLASQVPAGSSTTGLSVDPSQFADTPTQALQADPNAGLVQQLGTLWQQQMAGAEAAANNQVSGYYDQMALAGAQYDTSAAAAQQNAGFSLDALALQNANLKTQQGSLNRAEQYAPQLYANQELLYGLGKQGIEAQTAAENRAYPERVLSLQGQAAARGATSATGTQQRYGDLGYQHQQALDAFTRAGQQADISNANYNLNYQQQLAGYADTQKNFDNLGKELGLQGQEIGARLTQTINQLGLNKILSIDQLGQAIQQVRAGEFTNLGPILDTIVNASGLQMSGQSISQNISPQQVDPNAPSGQKGTQSVSIAQQFIGVPYSWGGTDPNTGLDCSGLVQDVFKKMGVNLPRTTYDQINTGMAVPSDQPQTWQPGDLIFLDTEHNGKPDHVGIYVGNGQMIDAPRPGKSVGVHTISGYGPIVGVRREF